MATCPTDVAGYAEEILTFTFQGIDGITIPKSVREEAYVLAVDVIIRSISRETYKNYECMPPESFYGTATIVMQDALELKIPVKFPRQRLYYGRVPEAFVQWNSLVNFEYMRAYFLAVGESLQSLGTALGAGSVPALFCCSLPQPSWQELPLREVYFHPPIGTQYELEVTWTKPLAFSDSCDTFYDGTSKQVDGDKDDGLPPNGIFPIIAEDPDDPYNGLPPETPDSVQLGFSNSKSANLGDADPESEDMYQPPLYGLDPSKIYNVTVSMSIAFVNNVGAQVGSTTGTVVFFSVTGGILALYSANPLNIYTGDYIGDVSQDVKLQDGTGLKSGQRANSNIFPPYTASGGVGYRLIGISGVSSEEV